MDEAIGNTPARWKIQGQRATTVHNNDLKKSNSSNSVSMIIHCPSIQWPLTLSHSDFDTSIRMDVQRTIQGQKAAHPQVSSHTLPQRGGALSGEFFRPRTLGICVRHRMPGEPPRTAGLADGRVRRLDPASHVRCTCFSLTGGLLPGTLFPAIRNHFHENQKHLAGEEAHAEFPFKGTPACA